MTKKLRLEPFLPLKGNSTSERRISYGGLFRKYLTKQRSNLCIDHKCEQSLDNFNFILISKLV